MATLIDTPRGYTPLLFKFGRVTGIGANERLVWDGANGATYKGILATESLVTIVSSSIDDVVGGGGATHIRFFYQGLDGIEHMSDEIALNGATPVNVPTILAEVSYRAFVSRTEDLAIITGSNHGNITMYETGTPANIMWQISARQGQTQMCFYRVPKNKFLEVKAADAYPQGGKPTVMRLLSKTSNATGVEGNGWRVRAVADAQDAPIPLILDPSPMYMQPGTYIAITTEPAGIGTSVSAYFRGRLHDYTGDPV